MSLAGVLVCLHIAGCKARAEVDPVARARALLATDPHLAGTTFDSIWVEADSAGWNVYFCCHPDRIPRFYALVAVNRHTGEARFVPLR